MRQNRAYLQCFCACVARLVFPASFERAPLHESQSNSGLLLLWRSRRTFLFLIRVRFQRPFLACDLLLTVMLRHVWRLRDGANHSPNVAFSSAPSSYHGSVCGKTVHIYNVFARAWHDLFFLRASSVHRCTNSSLILDCCCCRGRAELVFSDSGALPTSVFSS